METKIVEKLLKQITLSPNYQVVDKEFEYTKVIFKTKKYLTPRAIMEDKDFIQITWNTRSEELIHALILVKNLKQYKEKSMPLHKFIKEVDSFVGISTSLLAYGSCSSDEHYFKSRSLYDLPEQTKRLIYNYMKNNVKEVKRGIGSDSEGNSYNSIEFKEVVKV